MGDEKPKAADVSLRMWAIEHAIHSGTSAAGGQEGRVIEVARKFYDFVTNAPNAGASEAG